MTCPKCNGRLLVTDNAHNDEMNETYRRKKCTNCEHVIYTTEFEVDYDENFQKEWCKNYRSYKRYVKKEDLIMAQAKKCDRCKAFYEPYGVKPGEFNSVARVRVNENNVVEGQGTRSDLCPDCMKKFNEFMLNKV